MNAVTYCSEFEDYNTETAHGQAQLNGFILKKIASITHWT